MTLEYYVENSPSKIFSRLTPAGTTVNKRYLGLLNSDEKCKYTEGEARQSLSYNNYHLKFGYDKKINSLYILVEPRFDKGPLHVPKLGEMLQHPEGYSGARREVKEDYLRLVTNGRIQHTESEKEVKVSYKVLRPDYDPEKIFDAFWFSLKPVLNLVSES